MQATTSNATSDSGNAINMSEWVSLAEAAARLPSPRSGKRTHISTVYRLAKKHGLRMIRRGPWRFVHWPSVLQMFEPVEVRLLAPVKERRSSRRVMQPWKSARLDKAGI